MYAGNFVAAAPSYGKRYSKCSRNVAKSSAFFNGRFALSKIRSISSLLFPVDELLC